MTAGPQAQAAPLRVELPLVREGVIQTKEHAQLKVLLSTAWPIVQRKDAIRQIRQLSPAINKYITLVVTPKELKREPKTVLFITLPAQVLALRVQLVQAAAVFNL